MQWRRQVALVNFILSIQVAPSRLERAQLTHICRTCTRVNLHPVNLIQFYTIHMILKCLYRCLDRRYEYCTPNTLYRKCIGPTPPPPPTKQKKGKERAGGGGGLRHLYNIMNQNPRARSLLDNILTGAMKYYAKPRHLV